MKLTAYMIVRDEAQRYLGRCIESALLWCDEVRVVNDASTDNTGSILRELALEHPDRVHVKSHLHCLMQKDEGKARQSALDWALQGKPDYLVSLDADEFMPPDHARVLRGMIEEGSHDIYGVWMVELWKLDPPMVRVDGGWAPHVIPQVFRNLEGHDGFFIEQRKWAAGRVPYLIRHWAMQNRTDRMLPTPCDVLHYGWVRESERRERYDRHMAIDGGDYHTRQHLESIMASDDEILLEPYSEADSLAGVIGAGDGS